MKYRTLLPLAALVMASACGQPEAGPTPVAVPRSPATTDSRCGRAESALVAFDPRYSTPEEAASSSLQPGFAVGAKVESPIDVHRYELFLDGRVVGHVDVQEQGGLWGATAASVCG